MADDGVDRRNEMAAIRTEQAHQRTQLARERTFSAWLRTGLALVVTGFATAQLLEGAGPSWLISLAGIMFAVLGIVVFVIAYWSYRGEDNDGGRGLPTWIPALLTLVLAALAVLALLLIFVSLPVGGG